MFVYGDFSQYAIFTREAFTALTKEKDCYGRAPVDFKDYTPESSRPSSYPTGSSCYGDTLPCRKYCESRSYKVKCG